MRLLLTDLLSSFLSPPGCQIALFLIALRLFATRPKTARLLVFAALSSLYFLSTGLSSDFLSGKLEGQNPEIMTAQAPNAQAIVALGNFFTIPEDDRLRISINGSTDRLYSAVQLYKASKAPLLVLSGGSPVMFGPNPKPQAEFAKALAVELGVPSDAVLTEGTSESTYDNAVNTKKILSPRGIHRILLVTSALHLPRAAAVFRKQGFVVLPFPADIQTTWRPTLESIGLSLLPNPRFMALNNAVFHECLGIVVYRLRGWL